MSASSPQPALPPVEFFCPHCGYSLRGLEVNRCPECGKGFDPGKLSASRIPWSHRHEIGRVRAFFRTLSAARFMPGALAATVQAGLPRRDARLFAALCFPPVALGLWLCLRLVNMNAAAQGLFGGGPSVDAWPFQLFYPLYAGLRLPGALECLSLWLAYALLILPARIARFWPATAPHREGLITAAYYLAGALLRGALLGGVPGLLLGGLLVGLEHEHLRDTLPAAAGIALLLASVAALLLWLEAGMRFHRHARQLCDGVGPSFWFAWPVLLLGTVLLGLLLLWCAGLLALILSSWPG